MKYVSKEIYSSIMNCSEKLGICLSKLPASNQYTEVEIIKLYQQLISETDENIGVKLGRVFEFSDIGIFGEIAARSFSLLKMLKLMSYFQGHLCKELSISVKEVDKNTEITIKLNRKSFQEVKRQIHDFHIFAFLNYISETFSGSIKAEKILFSYERPDSLEVYKKLNVKYEFDAEESKLIFKTRDLNYKNPFYDEKVYRLVKKKLIAFFSPNVKLIEDLRNYIKSNLGLKKISLKEFSVEQGISLRKIERELQKKGMNFSDLTINCRIEKLNSLIHSSMELSEVAHELGLYDQSSLNNFTKKYLDKTPLELR